MDTRENEKQCESKHKIEEDRAGQGLDVKERDYAYWLCHLPFLGGVSVRRLYNKCGSFEAIFNIEGKVFCGEGIMREADVKRYDAFKIELDPCRKELEKLEAGGIRFITYLDPDYPGRLLKIDNYPAGITLRGTLPDEGKPAVSIIGARNCTNYGIQMAEFMARELAKAGVEIISGLASGIDSAGHKGALAGGGKTYGILGCGIRICYPRENYALYRQMAGQGGIITEFMPDEQPIPRNFPMRNRIISGLSDAVLVMEAKKKSGSLITAGLALDQGKDVFALPGRVGDPLSEGCNQLIRDGAGILLSPEDVLEYFSIQTGKLLIVEEKNENGLAKKEKMVYSCLDLQPTCLEEVVKKSGLSVGECMSALIELELGGYIVQTSHQYYGKKR